MRFGVIALVLALLAPCPALMAQAQTAATAPADARIVFPAQVSQGGLVIGKVPPGSKVRYGERQLRTTAYGTVVFGVGRDASGPLTVQIEVAPGRIETASIAVAAREFPTEYIQGVPPKTVNPPPEIAARIEREQAQVVAARARDDDRADFAQAFI
ncbi:M23 family peptidase, partial [Lysobacter sp. 2RAB21]